MKPLLCEIRDGDYPTLCGPVCVHCGTSRVPKGMECPARLRTLVEGLREAVAGLRSRIAEEEEERRTERATAAEATDPADCLERAARNHALYGRRLGRAVTAAQHAAARAREAAGEAAAGREDGATGIPGAWTAAAEAWDAAAGVLTVGSDLYLRERPADWPPHPGGGHQARPGGSTTPLDRVTQAARRGVALGVEGSEDLARFVAEMSGWTVSAPGVPNPTRPAVEALRDVVDTLAAAGFSTEDHRGSLLDTLRAGLAAGARLRSLGAERVTRCDGIPPRPHDPVAFDERLPCPACRALAAQDATRADAAAERLRVAALCGRADRRRVVAEESCPYPADSGEGEAWLDGWRAQDGALRLTDLGAAARRVLDLCAARSPAEAEALAELRDALGETGP